MEVVNKYFMSFLEMHRNENNCKNKIFTSSSKTCFAL